MNVAILESDSDSASLLIGLMHRPRAYASHLYNCAYIRFTNLCYLIARCL